MTTWLLPPRSGATFLTPLGNVITATLARPTPFADSDVVAALAQGWTYSDTAPLAPLGELLPIQFTSGLIQYPFSAPLATGVPNVTLTNSIGLNNNTQFTFATIRGGAMGPTSQLEIFATLSKLLDTSANVECRVGPASGTYLTATLIGGINGLTTQRTIGIYPEIWNAGTLNSQFATPFGMSSAIGTNGSNLISTSIDTSLDWNIYFGLIYTVAPVVGDSVTLRKFRINIIN